MPRKTDSALEEMETQEERSPDAILDEKLDMIIGYLHRAEGRDRMRMASVYIRSLLGILSLGLLFWSFIYFIYHGQEFIKMVTSEAVKQSASYMQTGVTNSFEQYMGGGQK